MSCYHPMVAVLQEVKENGKGRYKIFGQREGEQFLAKKDDPLMPPIVQIPCGQCLGCRIDHAKMWADRCMMELQDHQESYFLTLTYDDVHIRHMVLDCDDGEPCEVPTLYKKDLQDFWKRLRKDGQTIRYFACGEYGDHTCRP